MTAFDFELIRQGRVAAVSVEVAALDDAGRAKTARDLLAYVKRRAENHWRGDELSALAVATIGCVPSAAAAARILTGRWMSPGRDTVDAVVTTARARGVTWLPELVTRLADRRPTDEDGRLWAFIALVLAAEGLPAPATDWFVLGWLSDLGFPAEERLRSRPIAERLRTDPFLDALLPRVFTVAGAGERLTMWESSRPGGKLALIQAIAELAAEGRVDRDMLLRGCLGRLLHGDRPAAVRPLLALLSALAPAPAEVAAHAGDYLRLLADAPSPVATAAQKALRTAPDLDLDAVLEASKAVLRRPDKALVRAQLTWLDALARRHPARAADVAAALAEAADHPAVELRERATVLAARHGGATPVAVVAVAAGDDLPPPPPPVPAPPPITDPDELAEEVAAFYSGRPFAALLPLERIADAVVRLSAADRPALRAALLPVLERHRDGMGEHRWDPCCLCGTFTGVLHSATDVQQATARRGGWAALLAAARRFLALGEPAPDPRVAPPHRLLRARLAEIGMHAARPDVVPRLSGSTGSTGSTGLGAPAGRGGSADLVGSVGASAPVGSGGSAGQVGSIATVGLLAAPTWANGALDTAVLLDRLAVLGGHEPWPWDFTQALLRLPPGIDEPSAARAEALGTTAGARVAAWLRTGGLPSPRWHVETVSRRPRKHAGDYEHDSLPLLRVQVGTSAAATASRPPRSGAVTTGLSVAAPGSAAPAARGADAAEAESFGLLGSALPTVGGGTGGWHVLWPGLLPWHRGLAAAHALPDVAATADMDRRGGAAVLPMLAEAAGDPGPALPIAVAYGLAARHEADRVAALDALLLLAAAGSFDAETAGRHLGVLAAGGAVTPARALQPLRDAAAAGAPRTVFRLLAAALPALLAAAPPPRGTPDLLTLAAETAPAAPGPVEIPGLADLAARRSGSRLTAEARRLSTALGLKF
ncbi:DUF6493 family protein [Dactylosporangium sp. NPDC000555]|uniref:DUF6493 family protein n=1 Tax=Dactylosporangium sp. NPDC000555 TaxID=3154260 RepID=UPI0033255BAD